jgi:hypothetical protein
MELEVMKRITFLVVCCLFFIQGCAVITTQSVPVEKVVTVQNTTQNDMYIKANNWMVDNFNNAESVIQFADKESGTVSGRYLLGTITGSSKYGPARHAYATIKIKVKDGATKITITPESFTYAKDNMYTLYTEENAQRDINSLMISYENSMQKVEDTDW